MGARPQFIKHKAIFEAFRHSFEVLTVHTRQHYDDNMSRVFFEELGLPVPQFLLDERNRSSTHGAQTAAMLTGIEEILLAQRPHATLVYGDTNSTLAGALAASKIGIPIIHVEAGLRSFNREMPEEINRVVTDHLSSLLFAPSQAAVSLLAREGITDGVHMVGDVMVDVLMDLAAELSPPQPVPYIFVTIHRPSNADEPQRMQTILQALQSADRPCILPLHPRTRATLVQEKLALDELSNIRFVDPLGYRDCLSHLKHADLVVTDSGGLQKEAYLLRRPCVTLRNETEWTETLENDCNVLVDEDLLTLPSLLARKRDPHFGQPYGDGKSAQAMAALTLAFLTAS